MSTAIGYTTDGHEVRTELAPWPRHVPHPLAPAIEAVRTGLNFGGGWESGVSASTITVRTIDGRRFRYHIEELPSRRDDAPSDQFPRLGPDAPTYRIGPQNGWGDDVGG